jgi:Tol biopolymer transport system component
MSVPIGKKIGPYEIRAKLGAGGMGEVYLARDTQLERDVALKILPLLFADDPARQARFKREARMLAALNHPNIAHIHGLEEEGDTRALIMELVQGDDLAERIARGPIPHEDVIPMALQMARGLAAAHDRGIVHRDLKPANVKVTPEGTVKVIDFGLGKAVPTTSADIEAAESRPTEELTLGTSSTGVGIIVGTPSYMSPEQASAMPVDKRTDIWSFGCILFEMLTGRQLFSGRSVSEVLGAVLREDIDWTVLPPDTPVPLRRLLTRCLERDPLRRLRDIGDAVFDLEAAGETRPEHADQGEAAADPFHLFRPAWIAAIVAMALIGGTVAWMFRARPAPAVSAGGPTRFELRLPGNYTLYVGLDAGVAVSPDGQRVAIGAYGNDEAAILVQRRDEFDAHFLSGTEGGTSPFFSPDGEWLGFFGRDRKLRKVRVSGGESVAIGNITGSRTATWGADGMIVFDGPTGLMRVPADGGTPTELTRVSTDRGEILHWAPRALDGGRTVLFTVLDRTSSYIAAVSTSGGEHRKLVDGTTPAGLAGGHLVHARGNQIVATPFDAERLSVTGSPVVLASDVRQAGPRVLFDMAPSGTLAYQPAFSSDSALVWVDREGRVTPAVSQRAAYEGPRLSPDDRLAAVTVSDQDRTDVWIVDLERGSRNRLTNDGTSRSPVWMPDGTRVVVTTTLDNGRRELREVPADGSGSGRSVTSTDRRVQADSVSPDGRLIAATEETLEGIQSASLTRGRVLLLSADAPPRPLIPPPTDTRNAQFSPDGRWIVYVSNQSDRNQVFLRPSTGPESRIPVSTSAGWQPVWSRDGRELYYRESNRVMRVTLDPATGRISPPAVLLDSPFSSFRGADLFRTQYDVARDGRFLMVRGTQADDRVRVLLNVDNEIRRPDAGAP